MHMNSDVSEKADYYASRHYFCIFKIDLRYCLSLTGNGETEREGQHMQEGATDGIEPGLPAVRTVASV